MKPEDRERLNAFRACLAYWKRFDRNHKAFFLYHFPDASPRAASALSYSQGLLNVPLMMVTLAAAMLLQIGANIINEIYDVRHGVDAITSPHASQALLKGRLRENGAFYFAFASFLLAALFGVYLISQRGWMIVLLGVIGLILAYGYTAPPLQYKYKAWDCRSCF